MRWEWENKVSLQRLLQKLKDADSSGAVLTKAEAKFMYDKMKVLEKIKAEMQDIMIVSQDEERIYQQIKAIIDKYMKEGEET